jgi:hypothetical protein
MQARSLFSLGSGVSRETDIRIHALKFQEHIHPFVPWILLSDTSNERDTAIQWGWSSSRSGTEQRYNSSSLLKDNTLLPFQ